MAGPRLLKIRVSLRGRPIKSYTFNQESIQVGRNPEADIFLDNPGISRDHLKLEMTPKGFYAAEDLGSANGTFLNDQPIKREFLMNNDIIRVGKFSLWVSYEEDRRDMTEKKARPLETIQSTTVLSSEELEGMMKASPQTETETPFSDRPPEPEKTAPTVIGTERRFPSRPFLGVMIVLAFALGTVVGAGGLGSLIP